MARAWCVKKMKLAGATSNRPLGDNSQRGQATESSAVDKSEGRGVAPQSNRELPHPSSVGSGSDCGAANQREGADHVERSSEVPHLVVLSTARSWSSASLPNPQMQQVVHGAATLSSPPRSCYDSIVSGDESTRRQDATVREAQDGGGGEYSTYNHGSRFEPAFLTT